MRWLARGGCRACLTMAIGFVSAGERLGRFGDLIPTMEPYAATAAPSSTRIIKDTPYPPAPSAAPASSTAQDAKNWAETLCVVAERLIDGGWRTRRRRCSPVLPSSTTGPASATVPYKRPALPRACIRCYVKQPAEAFPYPDPASQPRARRRSTVCGGCWAAEWERHRAVQDSHQTTWRNFEGVVMRECGLCHEAKPLEANFYVTAYRNGEPVRAWRCNKCETRRVAALVQRQLEDPEQAAVLRAQRAKAQREWRKRYPERYRRQWQARGARMRATGKGRRQEAEVARMAYRLRIERAGGRRSGA